MGVIATLTPLSIKEMSSDGTYTGTAGSLVVEDGVGITMYPHRNDWYWVLFNMSTCPEFTGEVSITVTYKVRALASFHESSTIVCCGESGWSPIAPEHACGPYGGGDTDWHVFSTTLATDPRTGVSWTAAGINSIYFGYGNWGGYYFTEDTSYLTDYLCVTVNSSLDHYVETLPATEVWATGATIHGLLHNNITTPWYGYMGFQWGLTSPADGGYINWLYSGYHNRIGHQPIQATISGLLPDRTYYYRACLHVGTPPMNVGNYFGSTLSFGGPVSIFGHGWEYVTAKKAEDDVSKLAAGRYYMDKSGNFVYESAKHRIA